MPSLSSIYNLENDKLKNPQLSTDHVRCFCNLPQCVTTGYMCKSPGGGCFSNFMDHFNHQSNDYRGQHGCLELLTDKLQRTSCEENPQKYVNQTQRRKLNNNNNNNNNNTLIFCCYHDMCNHIDSPQTKNIINRTLPGEIFDYTTAGDHQQPIDYTNSQLWFRAATIAVPICGAFILFVLIAIAIKILRNENRYATNQKLSLYKHSITKQNSKHCKMYENILKNHQQHQQQHENIDEMQRIQIPLLVQNELTPIHSSNSNNKNETNAKLNLVQSDQRVILEIEKEQSRITEINLIQSKYCDDKHVKTCLKDPPF